jgi:hypothetical protein
MSIDRIEQIDRNLAVLNKIADRGDHLAAGLEIAINVGVRQPDDDYDLEVSLGLMADTPAILALIRDQLLTTRKWYVRQLSKDLEKLQAFLAKEAS